MAGTGKTSLMQRMNSHLSSKKKQRYVINLDPAVYHMPYKAHIDIRDTVNYKKVMQSYNLGPNGGILTALNLFTTKFDQVLGLVDKRASKIDYVLVDTPGQIEIFTWSASGSIITDSIASTYPTVVLYVIDTPRSVSPVTFMSNMLYACSILYKTRLPFVLVFNKTDVVSADFAKEWMQDFDAFQSALEDDETYMGTLVGSMCLVLEEFYKHLHCVGVSAVTGEGMDELFNSISKAAAEYETEYKPNLAASALAKEKAQDEKRKETLAKLMNDISIEEPSDQEEESLQEPISNEDLSF
jgi:GTPase SAR1 family protein